jgi:hypothetical protein
VATAGLARDSNDAEEINCNCYTINIPEAFAMRLNDLYDDLLEAKKKEPDAYAHKTGELPPAFKHSMPDTHSFPKMDSGYGYYRFVVALAGHPDTEVTKETPLRDQPVAVAYTEQEHQMIHKVCDSLGIDAKELSYKVSSELPDTYTKSPVMKFHMSEGQLQRFIAAVNLQKAMGKRATYDLFEDFPTKEVSRAERNTLPQVVVMPELNSGNNYPQYRFMTIMAAARAVEKGEVPYKKLVPWASAMAVAGYAPEEVETAILAAKQSGFAVDTITDTKSHEPDWVNTTSPVMKFKMDESQNDLLKRHTDLIEAFYDAVR